MNTRLDRTRRRGADVVLIVEAAILLLIIWVAIRVLRLHTLRHLLDFAPPSNRGASRVAADRVGAAVIAVAKRLPFVNCLSAAFVADTMLRRCGYPATLNIGVRRGARPSAALEAHAWVECHGDVIVGQLDDLDEYVVLAGPNW
jgi:hypothetical protein